MGFHFSRWRNVDDNSADVTSAGINQSINQSITKDLVAELLQGEIVNISSRTVKTSENEVWIRLSEEV